LLGALPATGANEQGEGHCTPARAPDEHFGTAIGRLRSDQPRRPSRQAIPYGDLVKEKRPAPAGHQRCRTGSANAASASPAHLPCGTGLAFLLAARDLDDDTQSNYRDQQQAAILNGKLHPSTGGPSALCTKQAASQGGEYRFSCVHHESPDSD